MAKGRLGKASLNPGENNLIYTTPSGYSAAVSITVVNKNSFDTQVSLNICSSSEIVNNILPSDTYIEYYANIPAYSILERTGIVMDDSKKLYAQSTSSNVNVVVFGVEENV